METVEPWFRDGLRFHCTGCGKCCTGSPGYVYLSERDVETLALHFKLSPPEFATRYTKKEEDFYTLRDRDGSSDCIFLEGGKCSVYEARPTQCRTYPWWVYNLRDSEDWEREASRCEGINHPDAPIIPSSTIEAQCLTYLDNLLEQNFSL